MQNRLDKKRQFCPYIIIKTPNVQNKGRIFKAVVGKDQLTYKDRSIRVTPDFSTETLKTRRAWIDRCLADSKRLQMSAQTAIPSKA